MMKQSDCSTATALVIQGYLRANEGAASGTETQRLAEALTAIRRECNDWAENIAAAAADTSALEPAVIDVELTTSGGVPVSRAPYSLVSAAIALLKEAVDLNGPEAVFADFRARLAPEVEGAGLLA